MVEQIISWEEQCRILCDQLVAAKKKGEAFPLYRTRIRAIKPIDAEKRIIRYIASDETVDRYGDIVRVKGWELGNFKGNPMFLWSHDYVDGLPLGLVHRVVKNKSDKKNPLLIADVTYHTEEFNPFAESVYKLVLIGGLRMVSVGFDPIDFNIPDSKEEREELGLGIWGVEYLKQDLLELSQVKVPGNPKAGQVNESLEESIAKVIKENGWNKRHALVFVEQSGDHWADIAQPVLRSLNVIKGAPAVVKMDVQAIDVDAVTKFIEKRRQTIDRAAAEAKREAELEAKYAEHKKVIPFKNYGFVEDEGTAWDGPAEVAAADVDDLKKMTAWVDADADETKGAYKLPHHRQSDTKAVWAGVANAMGALLGARGGVDIPDDERKGVYNHLKKHYAHWDKEVPEFKSYTDVELKALFPEEEDSLEQDGFISLEKDKSLVIALPQFDKAGMLSLSWEPAGNETRLDVEPGNVEGINMTAHLEEMRRMVRDEIREVVKTARPGNDAGGEEGASQTPAPRGDGSDTGKKGAVEMILSKAREVEGKFK